MSDRERWGTRDLTYSNWHRVASIERFVGAAQARALTMIDLDGLEYCCRCREVVGLVEVARDVGQAFKPSIVTGQLAHRLGVPGLLAFYMPSQERRMGGHPDIERFRARVISRPDFCDRSAPAGASREFALTPAQFARWLLRMHERCPCRLADDLEVA